jgi:hypothetical protein
LRVWDGVGWGEGVACACLCKPLQELGSVGKVGDKKMTEYT